MSFFRHWRKSGYFLSKNLDALIRPSRRSIRFHAPAIPWRVALQQCCLRFTGSLILSGCHHSVNFLLVSDFFSCILQPVTFSTCLQDVAAMRQSIQYGSGQSCVAQYLRPLLERQVRCYNNTRSFIRLRNDIEEQFASRLACRHIS